MASPIYILTPIFSEEVLDSAIFVSSTSAMFAKFNMIKPQPKDTWRAGSLSMATIDVDLTTAQTVQCAALLFSTTETGTTYTVTAGATQGASTYSSGTLTLNAFFNSPYTIRRHLIHIPATPQTHRWWRFSVDAQTVTILTVGNLFLGTYWRPNVEYGASFGGQLSGDLVYTDGGTVVATAPWREFAREYTFHLMANTELEHEENMQYLLYRRAKRKPILVVRDLSNPFYTQQRVVWGYITDIAPITIEKYNQWRCRVTIRGMI